MFRRVYLDNSATTPIDPEVLEAMLPYFGEKFGNASSIHFHGQEARAAVDKARHQVAHLINARPSEITFTSGGTEANNLAIRGLLQQNAVTLVQTAAGEADKSVWVPSIITSIIEHSAVKNVCEELEKGKADVIYLPVYDDGVIRIEDVEAAITDRTVLITVMMVNNEIGTIQPIRDLGVLVRKLRSAGHKIWLHTDAVQAAGKIDIDVEELGCDLLSLSAHKIHGPKGVGALYVRRGVRLKSQMLGGHQERERRGGTESVPLIAAFGKACELAKDNLAINAAKLISLRDNLEAQIEESVPDIVFNGTRNLRAPHISNISFTGVEGEGLLISLDMQGVAVSTGSACSSGSLEPSPVIRALGRDESLARGAIRFSFGSKNTADDVHRLLEILPAAVDALRRIMPQARVTGR